MTLDEVVTQATTSLRLVPGDLLFACGSVVEGFANARSDLDLYLVTDRDDVPLTSAGAVTMTAGRCVIDVRVVRRTELEALLKRFASWTKRPRVDREAIGFAYEERKLLHRLCNGVPLYGAEPISELLHGVDRQELARRRLDQARYLAGTIQIDLAGLRDAGDARSMVFAAQALLEHTADALLAGHLDSNPSRKWRIRSLARLAPDWERSLAGVPAEKSASDLFWSLHRAPQAADDIGAALTHSLEIVALSRRIFPWAERRLLDRVAPPPLALEVGGTGTGRALPYLDLDVVVRYDDGRYVLMRPNAPGGRAFILSAEMYSVLCLFDGKTREETAFAHAERLCGRDDPQIVDDVRELVRYGGFELRETVDERALAAVLGR